MPEEIWNQGLTPRHADGRVRSGMGGIEVILLPRGTSLYRFQTAGAGQGGWWSTREVLEALVQMSQASGFDLGTQARLGNAVLHGWSALNELVTGEVIRTCMAFSGRGRPQAELIPCTNFKIVYASCQQVPQVYVPSEDLVGRTGRREQCVVVRRRERIKSANLHAEHHGTPLTPKEAKLQKEQYDRSARDLDAAIRRLKQDRR